MRPAAAGHAARPAATAIAIAAIAVATGGAGQSAPGVAQALTRAAAHVDRGIEPAAMAVVAAGAQDRPVHPGVVAGSLPRATWELPIPAIAAVVVLIELGPGRGRATDGGRSQSDGDCC